MKNLQYSFNSDVHPTCSPLSNLLNYTIDWIVYCALNNFRGLQLGHGFWITGLKFASAIFIAGKESGTVKSILD